MKPPPIAQPTAQELLAELLQQRLTKNPELAAKQARLLAILALTAPRPKQEES